MPMNRIPLLSVVALAACSPPAVVPQNEAPPVVTDLRPDRPPPPRGEALLRDVMLARQNAARAGGERAAAAMG